MRSALTGFQRLWFVVLPQAFRIAVPPIGNQYLNLIKNSSLGAAIGYYELTHVTQMAVGNGAPAVPAFSLLMAIYLVISLISAVRQHRQPPAGPGGAMSTPESVAPSPVVRRLPDLAAAASQPVPHAARRRPHRRVRGARRSTSSTGRWRSCSCTGRWEIIRVNLKLLMVGRYPNDDLPRISVADRPLACLGGLVAGFVRAPAHVHRPRRPSAHRVEARRSRPRATGR